MERGNIKNLTEIELHEIARKFNIDVFENNIDRQELEDEILDIFFENENSIEIIYSYLTKEIYSYFGQFLKNKFTNKELSHYFSKEENITLLHKSRTWLYTYWDIFDFKNYKSKHGDIEIVLRLEKIKHGQLSLEEEIILSHNSSDLSIYIPDTKVRYRTSIYAVSKDEETPICYSNIIKISDFGVKDSDLFKSNPHIFYESGIHLINDEGFLGKNNETI